MQHTENTEVKENRKVTGQVQNQKFTESLCGQKKSDLDLQKVIDAWPKLSAELRQAIVKMIQ